MLMYKVPLIVPVMPNGIPPLLTNGYALKSVPIRGRCGVFVEVTQQTHVQRTYWTAGVGDGRGLSIIGMALTFSVGD